MDIKEVAYKIKTNSGYDKYYFETSLDLVLDLNTGDNAREIIEDMQMILDGVAPLESAFSAYSQNTLALSSIRNNAVLSVPQNAWTTLNLNTIVNDNGHIRYSTSDNSIEVLKRGYYLLNTNTTLYQLPKGKYISSRIMLNGNSTNTSNTFSSQGNTYENSNYVGVFNLNVGDKLKLEVKHDGDASVPSDLNTVTFLFLREVM